MLRSVSLPPLGTATHRKATHLRNDFGMNNAELCQLTGTTTRLKRFTLCWIRRVARATASVGAVKTVRPAKRRRCHRVWLAAVIRISTTGTSVRPVAGSDFVSTAVMASATSRPDSTLPKTA